MHAGHDRVPPPQQPQAPNISWSFGGMATTPGTGGPTPGQVVGGRYRIDGMLGQGAMGAVFRASDLQLGRPVAIKVMRHAIESRRRERFLREGELVARLDHAGIVGVHTSGVSVEERPFLVLELVEGARELEEVLGEGAVDGLGLLHDVARAVGYAHQQGVVHRDLKPANVLVDARGQVKVCDFGIAWTDDMERLTRTGEMVGSPLYMAPECFSSKASRRRVEPTVDVWALGVMLYEQLTDGQFPFDGRNLTELMSRIASGQFASPRSHQPDVPPALEDVCLRALSLEPSDRFADGDEFAEALDLAHASNRTSPTLRAPGALSPTARAALAIAVVVCLALLGAWWGGQRAARERALRAEALLEGTDLGTAEALKAARLHLGDARTLVGEEPEWADRLQAREALLGQWERLLAANDAPDPRGRALRLKSVRESAGSSVDPALASALDAAVVTALRPVIEEGQARTCLALPDLARSRAQLELARTLAQAIAGPAPSDATRLAERATALMQTEVLVARSRLAEPFTALLDDLSGVLAAVPPDMPDLARRVRLELGLMHARGGRFARAMRVLEPLFGGSGPEARVARAEAITLSAMCEVPVDVGTLIDGVLASDQEDPWRHVALQRKGIRERNTALTQRAERALVERHPEYWFSQMTKGDGALSRQDGRTVKDAYDAAGELSPRDARVWWWEAASLGTALRFAALLPKPQRDDIRGAHRRAMADLKAVRPIGAPTLRPSWGNLR